MSQKIFVKLKNIGKNDTLIRSYRGSHKENFKIGDIKDVEIKLAQEYAKNGKKFTIINDEQVQIQEPKKKKKD